MAICSNTCISKGDTMLGTKRIELIQVQSPCQAKTQFLCPNMIIHNFSKTAHLMLYRTSNATKTPQHPSALSFKIYKVVGRSFAHQKFDILPRPNMILAK